MYVSLHTPCRSSTHVPPPGSDCVAGHRVDTDFQWMPEHRVGVAGLRQRASLLTFPACRSIRLNMAGLRKSLSRETRSGGLTLADDGLIACGRYPHLPLPRGGLSGAGSPPCLWALLYTEDPQISRGHRVAGSCVSAGSHKVESIHTVPTQSPVHCKDHYNTGSHKSHLNAVFTLADICFDECGCMHSSLFARPFTFCAAMMNEQELRRRASAAWEHLGNAHVTTIISPREAKQSEARCRAAPCK